MSKFSKVNFLLPIHEIESSALDQIETINNLDFVKSIAIMPDVHTGYDMPIGGVALLDNIISPAFVGYDIGCGMCFYDTKIDVKHFKKVNLSKLENKLYYKIPVGTNRHNNVPDGFYKSALGDKELDKEVQKNQFAQLGTLGQGNHFLEIGITCNDTIGITVHSGSRNLGHRICTHYLKHGKWFDFSSNLGKAYFQDMLFAINWALENRKRMIGSALYTIGQLLPDYIAPLEWGENIINKNHNTATFEQGGIVHRKGATSAFKGEIGIIPGNMRDGVYIVEGLGNPTYLNSCSHGAGRSMGRKKAKESLNITTFKEQMKGIIAKVNDNTLDESPEAYKDIVQVIFYQQNVVMTTVDHVKPILNIKG